MKPADLVQCGTCRAVDVREATGFGWYDPCGTCGNKVQFVEQIAVFVNA